MVSISTLVPHMTLFIYLHVDLVVTRNFYIVHGVDGRALQITKLSEHSEQKMTPASIQFYRERLSYTLWLSRPSTVTAP